MKKEKTTVAVGCLKIITRLIIGILLLLFALGFGYQKGFDGLEALKGIYRVVTQNSTLNYKSVEKAVSKLTNTEKNGKSQGNKEPTTSVLEMDYLLTYNPLPFKAIKQIELGELDEFGRARYAHIQLSTYDKPKSERENRLNYNPVGWHNYNFFYIDNNTGIKKRSYLMDRGHLVGFLFSGLNDEPRNIVPMTRYLNTGTLSDRGMDQRNPNGMLFYEQQLSLWLSNNKGYYLDYYVVPNYVDTELIPRSVTLYWTGFDKNGNQIQVDIDQGNSVITRSISSVTLDNVSSNAEINYQTGTAINTVIK